MDKINVVIQQSTNIIDVVIQPLIARIPIELSMTKPGPQGIQGPIGIQGIKGDTGLTGIQGITGDTGLQGEIGLSAYQVWISLGNIGTEAEYLIAITGAQGIQGVQGIQGIEGPQGIPGIDGSDATVTIANNLLQTVPGEVLDATQGKVINDDLVAHKADNATLTTFGHVKHGTLTTTLDTTWTGSVAPFTKVQTVTGILAADTPFIDVVMSGTYTTDVGITGAWGGMYRAVTTTNTITFYASEKPTVSIPLQIRVVR